LPLMALGLHLGSLRQAGPVVAAVGLVAPVTGTGTVTPVPGTSIKDTVIIGTAAGGPTALALAGGGTPVMSSGSGFVTDEHNAELGRKTAEARHSSGWGGDDPAR